MRLLKLTLSVVGPVAFIAAPMAVQPAYAAQPAATAPIVQFAQSTTENVVEAEGYSVTTRATLRLGSSGSDVKFLQQQLKERGYYKMAIDGLFGSGTGGSVKAYQGASGLKPDGIVGPATWASLGSTSPPSATPPPSTPTSTNLKYGARGPEVGQLQQLLKQHGYYTMSIDDDFGIGTANAVLNYQRAKGLADDAVVGPATWATLRMNPQPPVAIRGVPKDIQAVPGVVIFVNQAERLLYFQRDHVVIKTVPVRVGGFTRVENKAKPDYGQHRIHPTVRNTKKNPYYVYNKDPNPKSTVYGEGAMPYSVMFDPNMYIHYSADFARHGYTRSSHGCVNVASKSDAEWLFNNIPLWAKVFTK